MLYMCDIDGRFTGKETPPTIVQRYEHRVDKQNVFNRLRL